MATPYSDAGRLVAEDLAGDNAPPLSVSDLSLGLKRMVEDAFGHVRVRAEVSGFKRHASGHCYLTLKDDRACIDGVIWKGQAAALRFRPEDGIEVIATGRLTTYPGRSKYQIVIERLELAGQGALMALLDQRRRALAAEGLFDETRKRPLPYLPRTIGVVTSPTGAVIRDILHRLADRFPSHVLVWPVAVQGEGAAAQVAAAVEGFGRMASPPDLVIVARGGGSIEDLWAFNEEVVVRAVAACPVPIISAVGHETDTTLCDFAADRRAPTPTAAAEMVVPVRADLHDHVAAQGSRMRRCAARYAERGGERLAATARRLPEPAALLGPQRQRLDEAEGRLPRALSRRLAVARGDLAQAGGALRPRLLLGRVERERARLGEVGGRLPCALSRRIDAGRGQLAHSAGALRPRLLGDRLGQARARLDALWRLAATLHPERPLQKGYAWVERRGGGVVSDAGAARAAGALTLHFADGRVDARVEQGRHKGEPPAPPPSPPRQQSLF